MKQLAVITNGQSDLLHVLQHANIQLDVIEPDMLSKADLNQYDCFAILGGVDDEPILFAPKERVLIEEQLHKGKKIFSEYCASIGNVYYEQPQLTRYEQIVYCGDSNEIEQWEKGDLIDNQNGYRIRPHDITCVHDLPILQFTKKHAHGSIEWSDELWGDVSNRGLWIENPNNLLVCSFQLCNFNRNRFSPRKKVKYLLEFIVSWLLDGAIELPSWEPAYELIGNKSENKKDRSLIETIEEAMAWFKDANILLDDGKSGVYEGLRTEISNGGHQKMSTIIRADCIGEVSQAYLFHYMLTEDEESLHTSDYLMDFIFNYMQRKDEGPFYGMLRWTNEAWEVCYQDDVARAIIPELLKNLYVKETKHLQACVDALEFLVETTGPDGTRVARTDNLNLNEKELNRLKKEPGNFPSAHYNAYYHAALLLAAKLKDNEKLKKTAITGLETIMKAYPNTVREHSQTQELCRLVFPLSILYWVTKNKKHLNWLYTVCKNLESFKHNSGGYIEWDDGYSATMRNPIGEGENSLLTENGVPVVDMLYANNWLPMAFVQAYLVTNDPYFMELWTNVTQFMKNTQIKSNNKAINGAWARSIDVDMLEVYGSPADSGWGPWAIESGWTQAQIVSGLIGGLVVDELKQFYI